MRTTRTLLLLTLLPALSWAQVTVLPSAKRPTADGPLNIYYDVSAKRLMSVRKTGPAFPTPVDTMNLGSQWTDKFNGERLFQQGQFNSFRQQSNGLYRPQNLPVPLGDIRGLDTALANRATHAEIQRVLSNSADANSSAFTKAQSDLRYPAATDVAARFANTTLQASMAQVRADGSSSPVPFIELTDAGRSGKFYLTSATGLTDDGGIILKTQGGRFYIREGYHRGINVKWYGAVGNGLVDDRTAIQAAVDFAKVQTTDNGGAMHITVLLTAGNFRINGSKGIDVTKANGVVIQGVTLGKYVATGVNGNCTGPVFDFTGSSVSGIAGLSIFSDAGEATPSRVAVQFALGQDSNGNESGGLNCFMRDCYVQMASMPSLNGGLGSIPLVNIRSEQFSVQNCVLKGDMGMLYSNRKDVTNRKNKSYSFESNFYTIKSGVGSMGVINATANSLETNGSTQPALFLNGVNSFDWQGYISIGQPGSGGQEYAIEIYQPMFTSRFLSTIEGYKAMVYQAGNCSLHQSTMRFSYANITGGVDNTVPAWYMATGANVENLDLGVVFGNGSAEMGSRNFFYTPPVNGGDDFTSSAIYNSRLACSNWPDNVSFISPSLFKQTDNTVFLTQQPVEVKGGIVTYLPTHPVQIGVDNSGNNGTITGKLIRFNRVDKTTTGSGNGGFDRFTIEGTIDVGGPGPASITSFRTDLLIHQTGNGSRQNPITTTTILGNSNPFGSYVTVTGVSAGISYSTDGKIGSILLTVTTTGQHAGEGVNVIARVSSQGKYYVSRSTLFD